MKIDKAEKLSIKILKKLGFSVEDSRLITENLIDSELAGRKSHGLVRLPSIKRWIENGKISVIKEDVEIVKETPTSLLIGGKKKPAFIAIYKSLDWAIKKAKKSGMVTVSIRNATYASGFIGSYARKAALKDLIFIGFNNSPGGLVPYGAKKDLWGTNPLTVGIPTHDIPVILDMASSKITWGDLLIAKQEGRNIEKGVAIDEKGEITTDPEKAMAGGLLPIAEHKGSGLAFIIELLAGALTGSRVGYAVPGGWGTFYILIDPTLFRSIDKFKDDVEAAIKELKNAPKAEGFGEIYFPGEQSQKLREKTFKTGEIEVSEELMKNLKSFLEKK